MSVCVLACLSALEEESGATVAAVVDTSCAAYVRIVLFRFISVRFVLLCVLICRWVGLG